MTVMVHNLEIASAATYFVGDLEAWGHNRGLGGNPFKGKSFCEIERMFEAKGFRKVYKGPKSGSQAWVNPRTGRSYNNDTGKDRHGVQCEPPHVDINYKKKRKGKRKKRLFR